MATRGHRFVAAVAAIALLAAAPLAAAQVELDLIVSRINGRIITESDVHQARTLKLVDDVSSDAAAQHALEDRLLVLTDMDRAAPVAPPTDAEIAARRAQWAAALGPGADALAAKSGMSPQDLQAWMRDDVRIRAYVKRQFGMMPDADRARATSDWLTRLRQRAESR